MTPSLRSRQPHGELRPGAGRAGVRPRRVAGRPRAGEAGPQQLRAAGRRSSISSMTRPCPRPVTGSSTTARPHRLRRSAGAEPSRAAQHQHPRHSAPRPVFIMRDGFPANYLDPANIVLSRLLIRAADRKAPNDDVASVQWRHRTAARRVLRGLGGRRGARCSNLAILRNLNQPLAGTRDANGPLPYPTLGHIQWRDTAASQNILGADFSLERRFVAVTASEVLHAWRGARPGAGASRRFVGPAAERPRPRVVGRSERLRRQTPVCREWRRRTAVRPGQTVADIRRGGAIFGGWTISRDLHGPVGAPFTVTQTSNNVGLGATGLPNLVGDPEGERTVDNWFNPAAFEPVPSGNVWQRRTQHPARTTLCIVRHQPAAPLQPDRQDRGSAPLGRVQRHQPRQFGLPTATCRRPRRARSPRWPATPG